MRSRFLSADEKGRELSRLLGPQPRWPGLRSREIVLALLGCIVGVALHAVVGLL